MRPASNSSPRSALVWLGALACLLVIVAIALAGVFLYGASGATASPSAAGRTSVGASATPTWGPSPSLRSSSSPIPNLQLGKVLFDPTIPTAESSCAPSPSFTLVTWKTPVYATYVFEAKPGSEQVSLEVTKAGASFIPKTDVPTADTQGLDCFGDTTDLSTLSGWSSGTYHFVLTSDGSEVASGELTVIQN